MMTASNKMKNFMFYQLDTHELYDLSLIFSDN